MFVQNAELETLKNKLRQYHDYDEIKRELEIMKVTNPPVVLDVVLNYVHSMSNLLVQITMTKMQLKLKMPM